MPLNKQQEDMLHKRIGWAGGHSLSEKMFQTRFKQVKKMERAFDRLVHDPSGDTLFDSAMRSLSFTASLAMPQRFHPGLLGVRPFLRPVKSEGSQVFTPWPARRNFFLASDFNAVKSFIMKATDLAQVAAEDGVDDFIPFETAMEFSDVSAADVIDETIESDGTPPGFISRMPEWKELFEENDPDLTGDHRAIAEIFEDKPDMVYRLAGVRIIRRNGSLRILLVAYPASQFTQAAVGRLMRICGAEVTEREDLILHVALTLSPAALIDGDFESGTRWSWFAQQLGEWDISPIGYGDRLPDNPPLSPENEAERREMESYILDFLIDEAFKLAILPAYFETQVDAIETDTPPSRQESEKQRSRTGRAPIKAFKTVRSLRYPVWTDKTSKPASAGSSKRSEPEYQVGVKGFWRRLRAGAVGRGPSGEPVFGRTWVQSHVRWREKPEPQDLPRVKSPLAPHIRNSKK